MVPGAAIEHWRDPLGDSPRLDSIKMPTWADTLGKGVFMSEKSTRRRSPLQGLPVIAPYCAGIDLGSEQHWVCAPTTDGIGREIEKFGATKPELLRMAEWLKGRQVVSVAMESTGVYWIPPHEVLEAQGMEVRLVDTRQLAQVPGRDKKSDPTDCEWLQRLHSCGLLKGCFRPPEAICKLRTLVRGKAVLKAESGDWVRRIQKSLDQMNVRVHRAVSDIDGVTGMAILRAIDGGERDGRKLAKLRHPQCRKSEEEIAEQLSGHWREDHLFSLRQALKMYDAIQERIGEYEKEILRMLKEMETEERRGQNAAALKNVNRGKAIQRRGEEPLRQALYRMSGVDLTEIDSIGPGTVEVVISEYGIDLSRFSTEKQFIRHATLAPHTPKTGGKPVRKKKPNSASSRVAAAMRMTALSMRHSDTALGAYYRRMAQRLGADVAIFATARKLLATIYRYLRWGQAYVDIGTVAYEQQYRQQRLKNLTAKAKDLGYQLVASQ